MNEPCSEECSKNMICDFCIRYDFNKEWCNYQNKKMIPYDDCDCNMFRCFRLDKKVKEE